MFLWEQKTKLFRIRFESEKKERKKEKEKQLIGFHGKKKLLKN